jgi:hypothetical protein
VFVCQVAALIVFMATEALAGVETSKGKKEPTRIDINKKRLLLKKIDLKARIFMSVQLYLIYLGIKSDLKPIQNKILLFKFSLSFEQFVLLSTG